MAAEHENKPPEGGNGSARRFRRRFRDGSLRRSDQGAPGDGRQGRQRSLRRMPQIGGAGEGTGQPEPAAAQLPEPGQQAAADSQPVTPAASSEGDPQEDKGQGREDAAHQGKDEIGETSRRRHQEPTEDSGQELETGKGGGIGKGPGDERPVPADDGGENVPEDEAAILAALAAQLDDLPGFPGDEPGDPVAASMDYATSGTEQVVAEQNGFDERDDDPLLRLEEQYKPDDEEGAEKRGLSAIEAILRGNRQAVEAVEMSAAEVLQRDAGNVTPIRTATGLFTVEREFIHRGDLHPETKTLLDGYGEEIADGPTEVVVTTQHVFPHPDAEADQPVDSIVLTVQLTYQYPGNGAKTRLVDLDGDWTTPDGMPYPEGRQAMIDLVDAETGLPEENGLTPREKEDTLFLFSASYQAKEALEHPVSPGVTVGTESQLRAQDARHAFITAEVARLGNESDKQRYITDFAEGYLTLLSIHGRERYEGAEENGKQLAGYFAALKELNGKVPQTFFTRARLIEAEMFGRQKSREALEAVLARERAGVIEASGDPRTKEAARPVLLETVIAESERLGIDPDKWIAKFGTSDEAKWELRFAHRKRLHEQGKDPEKSLRASINDLFNEGRYTSQFVYEHAADAIATVEDPHIRGMLIEQFLKAAGGKTEITVHNVDQLFQVSDLLLHDSFPHDFTPGGRARRFDEFLFALAQNPPGSQDERPEMQAKLARGIFTWHMSINTLFEDATGDIVDDVIATYPEVEEGRNQILDTVAWHYADREQFGEAQILLQNMLPNGTDTESDSVEASYRRLWAKAKTAEQVEQLNPGQHPSAKVMNPDVHADYAVARVVAGGNTGEMRDMAITIASELRQSDPLEDMINGNPRWGRLEQLVERAKVNGINVAQDVSRSILVVFSQEGSYVNLEKIAPVMHALAEGGEQDNINLVRKFVEAQPVSDIEKARWLGEFGRNIQ